MGDALNVKMGVCNVTFNGQDLGYTKGGITCSYTSESQEITVDQEDAPISELLTKQNFEVKVPMAEYNLVTLAALLPGATLVTDGVDSTKKKLQLSGASGGQLTAIQAELVLTPADSDANGKVTLHYAVPVPSLEFSYEKENTRVYEVTFKAMSGENGWVTLGDTTATA